MRIRGTWIPSLLALLLLAAVGVSVPQAAATGTASLSVLVLAGDGAPVPGALVRVSDSEGNLRLGVTDASGLTTFVYGVHGNRPLHLVYSAMSGSLYSPTEELTVRSGDGALGTVILSRGGGIPLQDISW